ncbi:hypothetical protein HBN54_002186 [Hymenobacter sp. 1B]|uniref:Uncharacterized protein n=1 Tax=Hymenobacter artigasi TaxID=2719616 RepID=A0ABX1HLA7_9BACT|nr:hypothetical protein [Hymenobacter artigasi]
MSWRAGRSPIPKPELIFFLRTNEAEMEPKIRYGRIFAAY